MRFFEWFYGTKPKKRFLDLPYWENDSKSFQHTWLKAFFLQKFCSQGDFMQSSKKSNIVNQAKLTFAGDWLIENLSRSQPALAKVMVVSNLCLLLIRIPVWNGARARRSWLFLGGSKKLVRWGRLPLLSHFSMKPYYAALTRSRMLTGARSPPSFPFLASRVASSRAVGMSTSKHSKSASAWNQCLLCSASGHTTWSWYHIKQCSTIDG